MKRYTLVLLLLMITLAGLLYGLGKMSSPVIGRAADLKPVDDEHAIRALEERIRFEEESEGWALRIDRSTVVVDEERGRVVRRDAGGQVEWATPLSASLRSWWWPSLLRDGRRIFVKEQFEAVWALDADTGKIVWRAPVSSECFWLSGNLLLLVDGPQVVGLAADSGKEVFRRLLPAGPLFRPVVISEAAGLFTVQTSPIGGNDTFVIDRAGQIRHHLPHRLIAVVAVGQDRVFLTSADIRRVTADDRTVWCTPLAYPDSMEGGTILEAPGRDLIALLYDGISNSGVQLLRVGPAGGKRRWEAYCNALSDVSHSEYNHAANVEWCGDRLRVVSVGSAGSFVEWLDGQTGKQLRRREERNPKWAEP